MKSIIFDMDGVIIDSEKIYTELMKELFKDTTVDEASIQDLIGQSDDVVEKFLEENYPGTLEEAYRYMADIFDPGSHDYCDNLNLDAYYLIKYLKNKGVKLALASSSRREVIEKVLIDCDLCDDFDFIISGEECKETKPSPEIYLKVFDHLHVLPKDTIIIEDSKPGIEAAKTAGSFVVAKKDHHYGIDQSKADIIYDDLRNIKTLLNEVDDVMVVPYKSREHLKSLFYRNQVNLPIEQEMDKLILSIYDKDQLIGTFVINNNETYEIEDYKITGNENYVIQKLIEYLWKQEKKDIVISYNPNIQWEAFKHDGNHLVCEVMYEN